MTGYSEPIRRKSRPRPQNPQSQAADICKGKHGGNTASIEANRKAQKWKSKGCQLILSLITGRAAGMTSSEIRDVLDRVEPRHDGPWQKNQFSGRLSELEEAGKIRVKPGARRDGCGVWECIPEQQSLWSAA